MHEPAANQIKTTIPFRNAYTLENPPGVGVLQNSSFVQLIPFVVRSGLSTVVVAPTTCSLTTCLTICMGSHFGRKIRGGGSHFGRKIRGQG